MTRNEKTSLKVAKIAAGILAMTPKKFWEWVTIAPIASLEAIRVLAASCLTQSAPKPQNARQAGKPARQTRFPAKRAVRAKKRGKASSGPAKPPRRKP